MKAIPVKLCYAMTINKSQEHSLNKIGIYLPEPIFGHGQLYVALSRATLPTGLKILIKQQENQPRCCTKNIVYSDFLRRVDYFQFSIANSILHIVTSMASTSVNDLKARDKFKVIEVKVYHKWVSTNPPDPTPRGYCCMLLNKLEHAIQVNMSFSDMKYFNQVMQLGSTYKISNFNCERNKAWQRTLPNPTTLNFGRFTKFENILPDGCLGAVGEVTQSGDPNKNQVVRRILNVENLNGNVIEVTMWDQMASEFDDTIFETMPQPIILAISSRRVTRYKAEILITHGIIDLQLSATPATHYYFNPNIQEVH
ncbi:hypothetical protein OSB04_003211 [Centaurea solstitialis]|uniref:Replication protein A OB domain-containing protein n=1 Tax=Centaurea solstitialis TaxID=347529 RepID=A0AA38WTM3_9ASTR|nr:hypothetical protein OSB04_003211 [Centaurea solstitialis]